MPKSDGKAYKMTEGRNFVFLMVGVAIGIFTRMAYIQAQNVIFQNYIMKPLSIYCDGTHEARVIYNKRHPGNKLETSLFPSDVLYVEP